MEVGQLSIATWQSPSGDLLGLKRWAGWDPRSSPARVLGGLSATIQEKICKEPEKWGEREPSEGFRSRRPWRYASPTVFRVVNFLCPLTTPGEQSLASSPQLAPGHPRRAFPSLQGHQRCSPLGLGSHFLGQHLAQVLVLPHFPLSLNLIRKASIRFCFPSGGITLFHQGSRASEANGQDPGAGVRSTGGTLGGAAPAHKRGRCSRVEVARGSLGSLNFSTETPTEISRLQALLLHRAPPARDPAPGPARRPCARSRRRPSPHPPASRCCPARLLFLPLFGYSSSLLVSL